MGLLGPGAGPGTASSSSASGGVGGLVIGPQPQAPQPIPDWIGAFAGMNRKVPAPLIGREECVTCQNLFIDGRSLKLRAGRTVVLDTMTAAHDWLPLGGTRVYNLTGAPYDWVAGDFDTTIPAANRRIKSNRTGAWADIYTGFLYGSDNRVEFVSAGSATYVLFGDATQNAQKVTGAEVFANAAWSSGAPNIKPSMGVFHKKRLWLDDVTNKGRIYLSDDAAPDTMRTQTSATDVTQGGYITLVFPDGDSVRGMASFGGRLVIMSERSVHFIEGSNFSNMTITSGYAFGTKSPRSLRLCENDLWFLDSNGIVRFISGSQPYIQAVIVSGVPGYYIEPLTQAITQAQLPSVHGVYHNRRFWLFDGATTGTKTAYCWEFRELPIPGSKWTMHTNVPAGASWTAGGGTDADQIYFLDNTTLSPKLWKFLNGATDGGTAMTWKWTSRAYDDNLPYWNKELERVAPQLLGTTGAVTVNLYSNLAASATVTQTLTYTGTAYERQDTKRLGTTLDAQVIQAELTGTTAAFECAGIHLPLRKKRRAT